MRPRLTLALACTPDEPALTDATTGPDASTSSCVRTPHALLLSRP
jgi:hypothetical protein